MNFSKQKIGLLLLFTPSIALAHGGIPYELVLAMLVGLPFIITSFHSIMILLLRWNNLFRHYWLTVISLIFSIITLILLILSIFLFAAVIGDGPVSGSDAWLLVISLTVIVINLWIVIWTFKAPKKQYRLLSNIQCDPPFSNNDLLKIKQ